MDAYDVVVVGGGPSGSTAANLVAQLGRKVLLLEKAHFPRHQIGESLLPGTVHGICALLGVKERIEAAGFPRKRGGTFRWGNDPAPWTFAFSRESDSPNGYAYQVERAKFDHLLLERAREVGAQVLEGATVTGLIEEGGRVAGVEYTTEDGVRRSARAKFVVGAAGNLDRLHKAVGERVYSDFFQNVALYAYFEGGKRQPAPNTGNILCAAFSEGWFWYIPLSDTLTSVGAVVSKDAATRIQQGPETAFAEYVAKCPLIGEYLAPARRVTEGIYGEYRVRKDYSYSNTRFWKPGLVLVGDAACFVDPVFSSGVHLATYSALLAARSIHSTLEGLVDETEAFDEFEYRYRREFGNFYQFLIAFYDMHQDTDSYFWAARKVLNTVERGNEAFVKLVAGVADGAAEPVFNGAADFFEARKGIGDWFPAMLNETNPGEPPPAPEVVPEFDKTRFDPDRFMAGFTSEGSKLQVQARYRADRTPERPLRQGGLVPSPDVLHWVRPT